MGLEEAGRNGWERGARSKEDITWEESKVGGGGGGGIRRGNDEKREL